MLETTVSLLMINACLLGFRHAIDWDHIAAILDIVNTTALSGGPDTAGIKFRRNKTLFLAGFYGLGHALMVVVLGFLASLYAPHLPIWFGSTMEKVVGLTLVVFGFCVLYAVRQSLSQASVPEIKSAWMIAISGINHLWQKLYCRITQRPVPKLKVDNYGPGTAFGVGAIHGLGMETATQIVLLAAVAACGNQFTGAALIGSFVFGFVIANTIVAYFGTSWLQSTANVRPLFAISGFAAGAFSIFVGSVFLSGMSVILPEFACINLNN